MAGPESSGMDADRWERLKELFDAALELDESERRAFLARRCEGDPGLEKTLDSLLHHARETGSSFDQAVVGLIGIEDSIATRGDIVGRTLGRYRIAEKIGEGGMGEVYRATDTQLGRDVAIKILPEEFTRDPERLARFEREAQVLAALNHPNIATIHGLEESDGIRYLVLELIEGETLRARVKQGPLPVRTVVRLAAQIADGLANAHEVGIVHRDLKPDNLKLTANGHVKILDFGLAKIDSPTGQHATIMPTEPDLETELGRVMGTSSYMSPEQARGETVDHRSDQFAFGSVLYEMATGQRAFGGETSADTLVAIMRQEPERPDDFDARVPAPLRWIIERCMAKDPQARYESTRDLAHELFNLNERFWEIEKEAEKRAVTPGRWTKRVSTVGGALFILAMSLIWFSWWRSRDRPVEEPATPAETVTSESRDRSRHRSRPEPLSPATASIAVLPLENLGPDEQEYFADGMTDALITHLARIGALKVISRTSVSHYKATDKTLPDIAEELDVDTVLVGSVLHGGDRVRISAQLIEAATDRNLWAESYEEDLRDILALQSKVAQAIAGAVRVRVDPEEEARIAAWKAVDPAAYEFYLKGLAGLEQASFGAYTQVETLLASVENFQRAIEIEPEWATPHAKMATAYYWLASHGGPDLQGEFYPKSKTAVLRALELDDSLAGAHSVHGRILLQHEWKWVEAEQAHRRAFELDPNQSSWGYARFLWISGRFEEALEHFKRVQERYPLSPLVPHQMGLVYLCAGRTEEAESLARGLLEEVPPSPHGYQLLGRVFLATSRYEEAVTALEEAWDYTLARTPWRVQELPYAKAKAGDLTGAREMLLDLEQGGLDWYPQLYLVLGQEEEAMAQIEAAFAVRRDILMTIQCSLEHERLMEIPRFREIVESIRLPS